MGNSVLLYIEDDELQGKELSRALRSRGYDVFRAVSGEEGIEILSNQPVDVVLCDLNMPGPEGLEVLAEIREKSPLVPVLILTSTSNVELAVQAIKSGAFDFIRTPPDLDEIDVSITNAVERKRLEKKLESYNENLEKVVGAKTEELERAHAKLKELNQNMEREVRERTAELEEHTIAMAQANVDLLGAQEELESKNEELSKAEERMVTIIDASPIPLIVTRMSDGCIVYANRFMGQLVGVSVNDLVGRSSPDFYVDPEDRHRIVDAVLRDGSIRSFELEMKQADGLSRWMMLSSTKTELAGEPVLVSGLYDIDDRIRDEAALRESEELFRGIVEEIKHKNEELRTTQSQLVQSEKMAALGMLVAGIAHEINTPIGAVSSMHDTLIRALTKLKKSLESVSGIGPEESSRFGRLFGVIDDSNRVIQSGIDRVTTIVRRLRSFARLDEAELKTVNINEGIEDTLTLVHHEIKHDITVNRNYGDVPPLPCFPGRLNQVFLNLVVNARQAMKGKGTIDIDTRMEDHFFVATFSDNGNGIRPENLKKIFDPGFTTKGVGVGTGLGLSICYRIIQEHFGNILVDSEVGRGTTFTVRIPDNLDEKYDEGGKLKNR
jgi:PAS domain S-box-containing protein